jgi:competence ComEA-like helix-hairpin-helix protein
MEKRLIFLFVFLIFIVGNVVALCDENQIDINSASLEELKTFTGIGDVKAQAIIDERPFDSVDDLVDVYGIGPATLKNMKDEGACVSNEKESEDDEEVDLEEEIKEEEKTIEIKKIKNETEQYKIEPASIQKEIISLNSQVTKDIKTKENEENKKINYPVLGLILFSILIGVLFLIRKRDYKNEFKE